MKWIFFIFKLFFFGFCERIQLYLLLIIVSQFFFYKCMLIYREGNLFKLKFNIILNYVLIILCYYLIVQLFWCGLNYLSFLFVFYSYFLFFIGRIVGQFSFGYRCDFLEVIVVGVIEVGGIEVEKDSDRVIVAIFVFQEICFMFWIYL